MKNAVRSTLFLLAMFVTTVAAVAMDKPRVEDNAGFFSPDAVNKANEVIAQMKREYGKDLYIETFPSIPAELRSQYQSEQRQQFYDRWAAARARDARVDGIIVLITREPSYLKVAAGADTQRQAFLASDLSRLREVMTNQFKAKQFDQGLLDGVELVRSTLAQSMPARGGTRTGAGTGTGAGAGEPAPSGSNSQRSFGMGSWLCIGFAVLMIFILFRAMRSRAAMQYPQGGGGYGAPGGYNAPGGYGAPGGYQQPGYGGGYPTGGAGRGLLGGLLGGVLGGYAYDRFMRRPGDPGVSDPGNVGGGGGATGDSATGGSFQSPTSSDIGTDFTGPSGSDFGGSGDAGGGDVGGGGGGGGGGDGGGSGGDF